MIHLDMPILFSYMLLNAGHNLEIASMANERPLPSLKIIVLWGCSDAAY